MLPLEMRCNWKLVGSINRRIKQLLESLARGSLTHVVFIPDTESGEVYLRPARDGEEGRVPLKPSKGFQTYTVRMSHALLKFSHLRPERGRLLVLKVEPRPEDGVLALKMKEPGSMPSPGAGRGLGVPRGSRKSAKEPAAGGQNENTGT